MINKALINEEFEDIKARKQRKTHVLQQTLRRFIGVRMRVDLNRVI